MLGAKNLHSKPATIPTAALAALTLAVIGSLACAYLFRSWGGLLGASLVVFFFSFVALLVFVLAALYSVSTNRAARRAPHLLALSAAIVVLLFFMLAPFVAGGI